MGDRADAVAPPGPEAATRAPAAKMGQDDIAQQLKAALDSLEGLPKGDRRREWALMDLSKTITVWAKLHNRKHVNESLLQHRPFLINFYIPLFLEVLPYAKAKWTTMRNHLDKAIEKEVAVLDAAKQQSETATEEFARRDAEAAAETARERVDLLRDTRTMAAATTAATCPVVPGNATVDAVGLDATGEPVLVAGDVRAATLEAVGALTEGDASETGRSLKKYEDVDAVSYTHLTLPTIYSV